MMKACLNPVFTSVRNWPKIASHPSYLSDRPDESYRDSTWGIWGTPILAFLALLFTLSLGFHFSKS
jgi:hypothetical protein